jgi:hypothetical protein
MTKEMLTLFMADLKPLSRHLPARRRRGQEGAPVDRAAD